MGREKNSKQQGKIGWIKPTKGNVYWKDVLHVIYTLMPSTCYGPGKIGYTDDHPLAEKLKICGYELNDAVDFLKVNDLIEERLEGDYGYLYLTKKGFDVAFQNERLRDERKTRKSLLGFTGIIAVSSVFTFMASLKIYQTESYQYIILWIFTLVLLFLAIKVEPSRFIKRK